MVPESSQAVFDFAAGRGALLAAVEAKIGAGVQLFASDLDVRALRHLRQEYPHWFVGRMDVLSAPSRSASQFWSNPSLHYDAVVLNPPFSYRGGASVPYMSSNGIIKVSPAVAFIAYALERVALGGTVVGLLPESALRSERDSALFAEWFDRHDIELVQKFSRYTFRGTRANTRLVRITTNQAKKVPDASLNAGDRRKSGRYPCCYVEIIRGRIPVHRIRGRTNIESAILPYIHTTNLRNNEVLFPEVGAPEAWGTYGPLLLIPRVGRPDTSKIVLYRSPEPIVLSDCVIGLRAPHLDILESLAETFVQNFGVLSAEYLSSCAPYITVRRLISAIDALGYKSKQSSAGSLVQRCDFHGEGAVAARI
jgi:tRNA1(Val) A37 N6-methylase TrmN6